MYCKHCGKQLDDDSIYCKYCGKTQEPTETPYEQSTKNAQKIYLDKKITCPNCKSHEIAFVTEYHKVPAIRILEYIIIFIFIIMLIPEIPKILAGDSDAVELIFFVILFVIIRIIRHSIESRTHVECICKDCGKVWLHD